MTETDGTEAGWYSDAAATFGDRLAAARETKGLSQPALAARLGVEDELLRQWEDDLAEPRANALQSMASMLDVSMAWLMTGAGEGLAPPEDAEAQMPQPLLSDLIADIRLLRAEMLRASEKMAQLEKRMRRYLSEGPAE